MLALLLAAAALGPWSIEYSVSGGIAGRMERLTLADSGNATVESRREGRAAFQATGAELAAVVSALRKVDLSGTAPAPVKPRAVPDGLYTSIVVSWGTRKTPIAGGELAAALSSLLARGLKLAEQEKWTRDGPFRPGKVWEVEEEIRDSAGMWRGESWHAVWTRRGETNTFDGVWRHNRTNQEVRDSVVLESAGQGRISLRRAGTGQRYDGTYTPGKQQEPGGRVTPSHGCGWRAAVRY